MAPESGAMKFGKKSLYYVLQLTGWLIYIFLAVFVAILTGEDLTSEDAMELLALLVVGIGTSHFYRYIIIKYKWTSLRLPALIPRALFAAFALAVISQVFFYLAEVFIIHKEQDFTLAGAIQLTINWAILY